MMERGVMPSFRGKAEYDPDAPMNEIFTHIWLVFMVNVGKYTVDGWNPATPGMYETL